MNEPHANPSLHEGSIIAELRANLREMADFGLQNPGHGYTLARMANAALAGTGLHQDIDWNERNLAELSEWRQKRRARPAP